MWGNSIAVEHPWLGMDTSTHSIQVEHSSTHAQAIPVARVRKSAINVVCIPLRAGRRR